jgi:hypothetical protein
VKSEGGRVKWRCVGCVLQRLNRRRCGLQNDSKKLCIRIEMRELDDEEGYYFKPFVMIH